MSIQLLSTANSQRGPRRWQRQCFFIGVGLLRIKREAGSTGPPSQRTHQSVKQKLPSWIVLLATRFVSLASAKFFLRELSDPR